MGADDLLHRRAECLFYRQSDNVKWQMTLRLGNRSHQLSARYARSRLSFVLRADALAGQLHMARQAMKQNASGPLFKLQDFLADRAEAESSLLAHAGDFVSG